MKLENFIIFFLVLFGINSFANRFKLNIQFKLGNIAHLYHGENQRWTILPLMILMWNLNLVEDMGMRFIWICWFFDALNSSSSDKHGQNNFL